MAKYAPKAIVIEAVKITAADYIHPDCWPDGSPFSETPAWLLKAYDSKIIVAVGIDCDYAVWDVYTDNGGKRIGPDDYLVYLYGKVTPVEGNVFEKDYILVEGEKE